MKFYIIIFACLHRIYFSSVFNISGVIHKVITILSFSCNSLFFLCLSSPSIISPLFLSPPTTLLPLFLLLLLLSPPTSLPSPSHSQVHDECDVGWQRLVVHRRRLPGEPEAGGHCSQQGQRVGEGRIYISVRVKLPLRLMEEF